MGIRITAEQAKRLGVKSPKSKIKDITDEKKNKGRNRSSRTKYDLKPIEFKIILQDDPKPKERPRLVVDRKILYSSFIAAKGNVEAFVEMISKKISRTYTAEATIIYENLIAQHAKIAMNGKSMFTCPVETDIIFTLKGEESVWPTSRLDGDADNLEKAILDALNGIVFEDDRLVVKSTREKKCGSESSVFIRIAPATP